ncbi:MAG: lysylphosphatidylglycerol synthase domain-containing protein [Pseudolabrys sp.]|nr:lysylphosphatidylglycerol synthase domain-containing protein [Pseudolabrys sp.]
MTRFRSLVYGAVTVVLLIAALFLTNLDFAAIASASRQLTGLSLLVALVLLLAGALLAAVRLWWISSDIGTPLRFRDAVLALSLGQMAGAITIQFFGHIAARTALLRKRGVSNSANIVMATYERAAAVFVSAAMAISGVTYLFGELSYDFNKGGTKLLVIVAGLLFVTGISAYAVWGRYALPLVKDLATLKVSAAILRNAVLTAVIQLCTAGAYVAIASSLTGAIQLSHLFAASLVVMFAASLPISFSGWGMREISAVFVLGAIGVPAPVALTMALVIGALAFVAIIALAVIAVPFNRAGDAPIPIGDVRSVALSAALKWILPIAAATAVYFQIRVPTGTGELSVNLADPIAILGGIVFVSEYRKNPPWRYSATPAIVAIWTLVVALAYANGYFAFGSNDWATINRLLGWLILVSYLLTGALIVAQADERGAALLAKTLTAAACGVVLFWSLLEFARAAGVVLPPEIPAGQLSGFSQNRNAFSFALLMALCALPLIDRRHRALVFGLMCFGLWLAGSYAAAATLAVIIGILLYLGTMTWRSLAAALLGVCAAILILQTRFSAGSADSAASSIALDLTAFVPNMVGRESSNLERLASLKSGFSLFLSHPFFGAGLGHFINAQAAAGQALVIHSTPIWLLAETGLVGFAAFVVPAALLFWQEFKTRNADPASQVLLLALAAFGVMSQAHELMYQRPIWLLLGVALMMRHAIRRA